MKRILFLTVLVFAVNVIIAGAVGLSAVEEQEQILITIEEGRSVDFLLVIQNDESSALQDIDITASGEPSGWIKFKGSGAHIIDYIPPYYFAFVPVTVSVPDGIGMGEYDSEIRADGSVLSSITIRVVLSIPDVEVLQETSNLDEEISRLSDKLAEKIDLNREDLVRQIVELSESNLDVSDLVSNKRELENQLTELQNQLKEMEMREQNFDSITGQLSVGSSANLVIGLFVGGLLVFLFLNRKGIVEFLNGFLRPSRFKRRKWEK